MRAGEIATIRLARVRTRFDGLAAPVVVTARALAPDEWPDAYMCLTVINRRLRADWCSEKDGLKVGPRKLDLKDILGVVLTVDGKSPYDYGTGPDAHPYTRKWATDIRDRVERGTEIVVKRST
jgi:hypothetical protein